MSIVVDWLSSIYIHQLSSDFSSMFASMFPGAGDLQTVSFIRGSVNLLLLLIGYLKQAPAIFGKM